MAPPPPHRRRLARVHDHLLASSSALLPAASSAGLNPGAPVALPPLQPQQLVNSFARDGFVSLGRILAGRELAGWADAFDRDMREHGGTCWAEGGVQRVNYDVLLSSPHFDRLVRHPRILAALAQLMEGPPALAEVSLRYMAPGGSRHQDWHRDHPHAERRRHRCGYFVLMLYLTDVNDESPCLSVSPESAQEPALPAPEQLRRVGQPRSTLPELALEWSGVDAQCGVCLCLGAVPVACAHMGAGRFVSVGWSTCTGRLARPC
jgi:hypothetical protein